MDRAYSGALYGGDDEAMKAKLQIDKPDELMATMTVTMKISEWRSIQKKIETGDTGWPQWAFASLIQQLVKKAMSAYDEATDETP